MSWSEKRRHQRWVDWAGCACAIAFSISLWRRSTGLGLLLAPTLLHNLMIAASFVMRGAPKARVTSFTARLSAYAVTALVPAYLALAPQFVPVDVPVVLRWISLAMWLIGCLLGLWGIWNLRYSFSIEPQARQLVTAGPYRYVRHPMYASYVLQYGAILLGRFSLGFALVMAAWLLLLWARMQFEETVLSAAFPGYEDYRRRVGALVPRFASREAPLAVPADSGRALEVQQWG